MLDYLKIVNTGRNVENSTRLFENVSLGIFACAWYKLSHVVLPTVAAN